MIKSLSLHKRNPKLAKEEFVEYWRTIHAPLVRGLLKDLGLRRFVANVPLENSSAPGVQQEDYDIAVELHFDDRAALEAAMSAPEFNTAERLASSEYAFDLSAGRTRICEEIEIELNIKASSF